MRVRMIRSRSAVRPSWLEAELPDTQTFIAEGKEYLVHAIAVFQGKVSLQIVDDVPMISWYPTWFFEVSDHSIPHDWICSAFEDEPKLVIGPEFVAKDIASYCAMVELSDEQVQRFWRRLDAFRSAALA